MKHTDTRIKVTRLMIHEGLLNLLKEKPISQISVKELVEEARINRSTFYLHYSSVMDVLKEIENEFVEEKIKGVDTYWQGNMDNGKMASIISAIFEDKELCRILMGKNGNPQFLQSIREDVKTSVISG